jgi:hypothetical protein
VCVHVVFVMRVCVHVGFVMRVCVHVGFVMRGCVHVWRARAAAHVTSYLPPPPNTLERENVLLPHHRRATFCIENEVSEKAACWRPLV